jgi:hypothetical protein
VRLLAVVLMLVGCVPVEECEPVQCTPKEGNRCACGSRECTVCACTVRGCTVHRVDCASGKLMAEVCR